MKATERPIEKITLERTGQAPLTFHGYLVSESIGHLLQGKEQNRWHDIAIYRTKAGNYIGYVEYHSTWKTEVGRCEVAVFDSPDALSKGLKDYDCTSYVCGFPPLEQYRERQERLLKDIQSRFEDQVSEVLDREECEELAA